MKYVLLYYLRSFLQQLLISPFHEWWQGIGLLAEGQQPERMAIRKAKEKHLQSLLPILRVRTLPRSPRPGPSSAASLLRPVCALPALWKLCRSTHQLTNQTQQHCINVTTAGGCAVFTKKKTVRQEILPYEMVWKVISNNQARRTHRASTLNSSKRLKNLLPTV